MKKILCLIFIIIISGIIGIYYYSENKSIKEDFYVIDSHYNFIYEENRRYNIDLYSDSANSIIEYTNDNLYQIINDNDIYTLNDVNIQKQKVNNYYVYQLSFNIFDIGEEELILSNPILKILNQRFTLLLEIGDIYILNPINYELLNINNYYASYSYLNKSLMLTGLNIEFSDGFNTLLDMNMGPYAKGRLDLALDDTLLKNEINIKEIIPEYKYNELDDSYLNLNSNTYFIPITYSELKLIKSSFITFNIDNKDYYLDYFPYIANILDLDDYKNYMKKGQMIYV